MPLLNSIRFIACHPMSRGRVIRNLSSFVGWQLRCRFASDPMPFAFVNDSRLYAAKGLHGATGNLYVGLHEYEEMCFAAHLLRPGDLLADVGANIGAWTVLAAAGMGANVVAFEPGHEAFCWLERNIALNHVERLVKAHRIAASAAAGLLGFTTSNGTMNRVLETGDTQVEADTLDRCLTRTPILIKIDVEGHEPAVLRGSERTLENPALHAVIAELSDPETQKVLARHGFARKRYEPARRALTECDGHGGNGIFVRDVEFVAERLATAPKIRSLGLEI